MSHLFDRLQLAAKSPLGSLLLILFAILLILGCTYLVIYLLRRKKDLLSSKYHQFFCDAEKKIKGWVFEGEHQANFFGRETLVSSVNGHGRCLIFPPSLSTPEIIGRYRRFSAGIEGEDLPVFSPCIDKYDDDYLILVHDGLVKTDRHPLTGLYAFVRDRNISDAVKETFLMELGKALEKLHSRKCDDGSPLYHGFLLPRTCYVEVSGEGIAERLVVADLGMAFTVGPEKLEEMISLVCNGKLLMDRYTANILIQQITMLAPEQKKSDQLACVGPPADYYAFGALAVMLFTGKFTTDIDWNAVPERWRTFLKQCLSHDPLERPKSFHDLDEWLASPELHLTHHEAEKTLEDLPEIPQHTPVITPEVSTELKNAPVETIDDPEFFKYFTGGVKAIKTSKWESAQQQLSSAVQMEPTHLEARIKLAIACYELGMMKEAEEHYQYVKEKDAPMAKVFRKHIAFRM